MKRDIIQQFEVEQGTCCLSRSAEEMNWCFSHDAV